MGYVGNIDNFLLLSNIYIHLNSKKEDFCINKLRAYKFNIPTITVTNSKHARFKYPNEYIVKGSYSMADKIFDILRNSENKI